MNDENKDRGPTESDVDNARSTLRADYYRSVRAIAAEIVREYKAGDIADLNDHLHETVDGNYWVIYTHANWQCLMASDNDGAADDEGIELEGLALPQRAYYALLADIRAELPDDLETVAEEEEEDSETA